MRLSIQTIKRRLCRSELFWAGLIMLIAALPASAASPWEDAVNALMRAFTGPIARGLSLVAVVVGGLMWAFGESDKRMLAGITFGIGMALGSAAFIGWLFP